jgi:hypothetical protein
MSQRVNQPAWYTTHKSIVLWMTDSHSQDINEEQIPALFQHRVTFLSKTTRDATFWVLIRCMSEPGGG